MDSIREMRKYNLKMNPLKCAFEVSARKFLGFVVHKKGIEINPKKVESINCGQQSNANGTCKNY
jgi:hypothetical protein